MKMITYSIALAMWALALTCTYAQVDVQSPIPEEEISLLKASKERIVDEEKDALKDEVEAINRRQERGEITEAEAEELKQKAAERRALNIENRLAIVDNKIALLERNSMTDLEDDESVRVMFFSNDRIIDIGPRRRWKKDRRTTSEFVFAFGLNNVITEGQSLNDSDFKIGGSRFAELGWAWKTRVFKESNWLRFKYGFSFQFNGLKPTDNRIFEDTGEQTVLVDFPMELNKSKFRMDNLVIPVHFEFGPSNKEEREDGYVRYRTYNKIKIGVGGYAGVNLSSRQKLKFNEDGQEVKQKLKADYNTNKFVYGLSGYIGWRGAAAYIKYDLNPIFKDNPVEQRNVSLGLRFDMD